MLSFLAVGVTPAVAFAAKPTVQGASRAPKPTRIVEMVGYDISYPQCGVKLPTDHYFGIVGVNGGTAASTNPCLVSQLNWANKARTGSSQPKVQLYVNTANPAQDSAYNWNNWPTTSTSNNPYGECEGTKTNSSACSWQYGWNRSLETEAYFASEVKKTGLSSFSTGDYVWWLDVETMNSWQSGSAEALARNVAAIEGFAAYYLSKGSEVGIYSTGYQWGVITGNSFSQDSNLLGLANWLAGSLSLNGAKSKCSAEPLTPGGSVSLSQYVVKNIDKNHSCF